MATLRLHIGDSRGIVPTAEDTNASSAAHYPFDSSRRHPGPGGRRHPSLSAHSHSRRPLYLVLALEHQRRVVEMSDVPAYLDFDVTDVTADLYIYLCELPHFTGSLADENLVSCLDALLWCFLRVDLSIFTRLCSF